MAINLSNLTNSAQKEYSKFIKDINYQKGVIEKCRAYAKECPSDALKRAKAGYEHNRKQLEDHDTILEERIERMIKKLREEGAIDKQAKEKYFAAAEEKLTTLENEKSKTEVNAKIELDKLTNSLELFIKRVQPNDNLEITQPPSGGMRKLETSLPDQEEFLNLMQQEEELANLRKGFGPTTTSWAQPLPQTNTIYGPVETLKRPVKTVKKVGSSLVE
jgi:ferredoxin